MKRMLFIVLAVLLLPFTAGAEDLDMDKYLYGHVMDSHEWHITTVNGKAVSIPLPCIVIDGGLHVFSSEDMEENGYVLDENGKLVNAVTGKHPVDLSITKNVLGLLINSVILILLVLWTAGWYKKHDVLKEAPKGIQGVMEMMVSMVENDIIKEAVGKDYKRYSPYLLTAFFFIFISNLMGIIPFFPGGANVTGNIAVTLVLALCTFLAVNLFGNKEYWKEILWPNVPTWLKAPLPIMPIIEIVGMFTKPFSLMIRLFANILAGHFMILAVVAVIFLTAELGVAINAGLGFVSILLGVFMDILELLVAFIQAYVFTMLSSVFIGMSRPEPENE